MKVAKIKKKEEIKRVETNDDYSIKNMLKILTSIVLIFAIFYFITVLLVDNRKENVENPVAVIDSSKIILSQLLNRKESEYYVIATKASLYENNYVDTSYITLYNNYIKSYKQKEKSIPFYYVDLDNAMNKKYLTDNLNITNNASDIKLNDEVLFKIKDGKIEKYYVGKEEILDKLSRL